METEASGLFCLSSRRLPFLPITAEGPLLSLMPKLPYQASYEVDFKRVPLVGISLRFGACARDDSLCQKAETLLFCFFAARQIANMTQHWAASALIELLREREDDPALENLLHTGGLGDMRIESQEYRLVQRGFSAEVLHDERIVAVNQPIPEQLRSILFGLKIRGLRRHPQDFYTYAPISVAALLYGLAFRRTNDEQARILWRALQSH